MAALCHRYDALDTHFGFQWINLDLGAPHVSSSDNTTRRFDSSVRLQATTFTQRFVIHAWSACTIQVGLWRPGSQVPEFRPILKKARCECGVHGVGYNPVRICASPRRNPTDDMRFLCFLEKIPIASSSDSIFLCHLFSEHRSCIPSIRLTIATDFLLVALQQLRCITGNRLPQFRNFWRYSFSRST